jgi:hypothetical protein
LTGTSRGAPSCFMKRSRQRANKELKPTASRRRRQAAGDAEIRALGLIES